MKIAVTGGVGFVGQHVLARLVDRHELIAIERHVPAQAVADRFPRVRFLECDIQDAPKIQKLTQGCDALVHLAGLGSVHSSFEMPKTYHDVNVNGTRNALEAARKNGIKKFVFASSAQVYGDSFSGTVDETLKAIPSNPYGVTKLLSEADCARYFVDYGIQTVPLRLFNVFGPGQETSRGVVAAFIASVLEGRPVTIYGSGLQMQDFVYAQDVAEAFESALQNAAAAQGNPVNIGSGKGHTVSDLLSMIETLCANTVPRLTKPALEGDAHSILAEIARARKILCWAPRTSLEDGLRKTIAYTKGLKKRRNGQTYRTEGS